MKKFKCILFILVIAVAAVGIAGCNAKSVKLVDKVKYSLVEVKNGDLIGSGFIAETKDNYCTIITNYHVIKSPIELKVRFFGENEYKTAEILGHSREYDIAVLKVLYVPDKVYTAGFGNNPEVGEEIMSFAYNGTLSAYDGIVSRSANIYNIPDLNADLYLVETTSLAPTGTSGGPCVDMSGKLMGLNAYNLTVGGVLTSLSYKIPSGIVEAVYSKIMKESDTPAALAMPFVLHGNGTIVVTCFENQFKVLPKPDGLTVTESQYTRFVAGNVIETINDKNADVLTFISELILTEKNAQIKMKY